MSGLTDQFVVLLMFSCFSALCEGTLNVTVETGEDAPLQCEGPRDANITVIKWDRPDLESAGYVFFFRENRPYEQYQHPSFRGRVELRDPEMKNGDVSVILKNVTVNDTGTYECVVRTPNSGRTKRHNEFRQFIILTVTDPGHTAGSTKERGGEEGGDKEGGDEEGRNLLAPLLTVAVVICVVGLVGGFVLRKRQRSQQQSSDPPPAEDVELQTLSPPPSNLCV